MKIRAASWLTAAALCGTLAGCSAGVVDEAPGRPGTPTAAGTPLALEGLPAGDDVIPSIQAYGRGETLTIVTWGSTSCPVIPEIDDIDEVAAVAQISLSSAEDVPCTANHAARTFEFEVGTDASALTVAIENGGG